MTPTLLLWLSLSAWPGGDRLPKFQQHAADLMVAKTTRFLDEHRRKTLAWTRQRQVHLKEQIIWMEDYLKRNGNDPLSLELRRTILVDCREMLNDAIKLERELWEQQPGGITAPPPREKK